MPAFSHFIRTRQPLRTVTLQPSAWADEAKERPKAAVAIGLRLLSERDLDIARAQAAKHAVSMFASMGDDADEFSRFEAYNDALMRWVVGRGCCDPNDVNKSYFDDEEDTVRRCLTSAGVRRLWDEIERLQLEESPILQSATDNELWELANVLGSPVAASTPARTIRVRKLLRFVLDELRTATP